MRNILLNSWILLLLIVSTVAVSLYYSISTNDFTWFGRSGSLATIFGLLLTLKHHILSTSRDIESVVNEKFHYAVWAPSEESPEYQEDIKSAKKILRDEYIGVFVTIAGTIIWGYGDLLPI